MHEKHAASINGVQLAFPVERCNKILVSINRKQGSQHAAASAKIDMINRLKKFFGKKLRGSSDAPPAALSPKVSPEQEARWKEWYDHKSRLMEQMLGEEHNLQA